MSLKKVTKGDTVILKGFTGIQIGVFKVEKATDKNITILTKNGNKLIFSRATGKQLNVEEGKERWANSIVEDDGSYVRPKRKKKTKTKPAIEFNKLMRIEEEFDIEPIEPMDDDFEDFEEE